MSANDAQWITLGFVLGIGFMCLVAIINDHQRRQR